MNHDAMQHLMAGILAEQPERADAGASLDEARLRRALSGDEPLNHTEQQLLWTSPAARRRLMILRDVQRATQHQAWQRLGVESQIVYLAAADSTVQPITIDTHPHLTVKLFPLDEQGERWTVFLKLSEALQQTLLTGIRLLDTGGVQWLAGHVDHDGELSADWTHDESPLHRLHRYALRLEAL
jgi:hypothetical protein